MRARSPRRAARSRAAAERKAQGPCPTAPPRPRRRRGAPRPPAPPPPCSPSVCEGSEAARRRHCRPPRPRLPAPPAARSGRRGGGSWQRGSRALLLARAEGGPHRRAGLWEQGAWPSACARRQDRPLQPRAGRGSRTLDLPGLPGAPILRRSVPPPSSPLRPPSSGVLRRLGLSGEICWGALPVGLVRRQAVLERRGGIKSGRDS